MNTTHLVKKDHQHPVFLRKLKQTGLSRSLTFTGPLNASRDSVWQRGPVVAQHENDWTQVVKTAQGALAYRRPDLNSVHATRVHKKARRIATDPTYPATHCLYRFHQESSRSRLRDSFFHRAGKAIALLRWDARIPSPSRILTHASPPFPRSYRRMSSLSLSQTHTLTHTETLTTFHWLALSAVYLLYLPFYIYILPLSFHLSMQVLLMCVFLAKNLYKV